jgi:adiponectin receptor
MPDMRARLPDLSDMCSKLDGARTRFQEIDSRKLLGYLPTLSMHLQKLHSHLSSTEVEFSKMLGFPSLGQNSLLREVLESLSSAELVMDLATITAETEEQTDQFVGKVACEVAKAVKHSLEGVRLITYHDLPEPWKNNPFVTQGYRYASYYIYVRSTC